MTDDEIDPTMSDPLAGALAKVQAELQVVRATETGEVKGQNKAGKEYSYDYKYADLAGIAREVYPLLAKNGLAFTAGPTLTEQGKFVLRWQLLHTSGRNLQGDYPLPADARSPQQLGSAITYGRRYCLSAVVGVITADDDGAAAQYAERQQDMTPQDPERSEAVSRVANAWQAQYGELDWGKVSRAFTEWSGGEDSRSAATGRLRAFAAYLVTLPTTEAGGDPPASPTSKDEEDPLGPRRRKMFALFKEVHLTERQAQLDWITEKLGRTIKSRGELEEADYDLLLKRLQEGDVPAVEVDDSPRMIGRGDLRALGGLFKQIGVEDNADRLHIASSLVGRTPLKGDQPAAEGLTAGEGKTLLAVLADCKTRDDVEALIRQVEQERAQGGEQA